MNETLIEFRDVAKTYETQAGAVHALRDINLEISRASFLAVMGPSGSGKSTLLNLLGLLDRPTRGEYLFDGQNVADLSDAAMSDLRCRKIGVVFQSFNLFPSLTVRENVCVPMHYADVGRRAMHARVDELLGAVGLSDRGHHRPNQLSGGQRQRAAIARALANDPAIILADEPTGNLDEKTGWDVINVFHGLAAEGRTVVMVTHNPEYRQAVQSVVALHDGRILES